MQKQKNKINKQKCNSKIMRGLRKWLAVSWILSHLWKHQLLMYETEVVIDIGK